MLVDFGGEFQPRTPPGPIAEPLLSKNRHRWLDKSEVALPSALPLMGGKDNSCSSKTPPSSSNPGGLALEAGTTLLTRLPLPYPPISAIAAAVDSTTTPMRIAIPFAGPVPSPRLVAPRR
ncbi:hypothetical protein J5N97_015732 [Dioscorea zingiberensis]|uniref:Uncharacterized protein n=1 Tax=Dioscorea zingiberensis TaxID=325984 RepID=A0A9D5CJP3_9LILI|nr:hypothetical protein J5N97_015732 [Dioscorea zingiberensis]